MISRNININAAVTFESYKEDNAQKLAAVNRRVSNTETTLSNQQNQLNQKQGKYDPFDINNARLNGKTVIEGGLIKTELINTNALVVKKAASIGDFYIGGDGRFMAMNGNSNGSYIDRNGRISVQTTGYISEITGKDISIMDGKFSVGFAHLQGDPDWHSYLCVRMTSLPHKNHIAYMPGGHNFHRVVVDENTGLMGWE